jgi:cytoskeletal protein RodZ
MTTMTRDMSYLQKEQAERLMQIGAYLRQVREESFLSLEEVAAKTMIQARLLRAIEAGTLHQLPEPVYIQGFLKRYAEVLGLDGTQFADAFPTEDSLRIVQQSSWKDSPAAQLRPLHLYVAYIALIAASVSLLSYLVGRSAPSASPTATATSLSPSSAQSPTQSPTGKNSPASASGKSHQSAVATAGLSTTSAIVQSSLGRPTAPDKPVRVDVKLTAQSWLRIVVDGRTEFEGVLPEGTERSWSANKELTIRAGNAGGVMLAYNSSQAKKMGEPGAVEERTFSSQDSASLPDAKIPLR